MLNTNMKALHSIAYESPLLSIVMGCPCSQSSYPLFFVYSMTFCEFVNKLQ